MSRPEKRKQITGGKDIRHAKRPRLERKKTGTVSKANYRFQSFTDRISKVKIDPIKRHDQLLHEGLQDETSHFRISLEDWRDRNLSANFSSFARDTDQLCATLPQLLHYESRIFELLMQHLQKADELSAEPLLSLVSHFAHDLGSRFETHFRQTLEAICALAVTNQAVQVVEWSFTCLAWLFKYLSRLLVPDLRPVFQVLAPLLGKARQKSFIARFAAEAMSFLVKKATAQYHKTRIPLERLIDYVFEDVQTVTENQSFQYQQNLALMFADSVKGIQHGINTSGPSVCRALVHALLTSNAKSPVQQRLVWNICKGFIIGVIHYTDPAGFSTIFSTILESIQIQDLTPSSWKVQAGARILFTLAATRKGSRIQNWPALIEMQRDYIGHVSQSESLYDNDVYLAIVHAVAASAQNAPFEQFSSRRRGLIEPLKEGCWEKFFLAFCIIIAEIDMQRFQALLEDDVRDFIASHWDKYDDQVCAILPRLPHIEFKTLSQGSALEEATVRTFEVLGAPARDLNDSEILEDLSRCSAFLELMNVTQVTEETRDKVVQVILQLMKRSGDTHSEDLPILDTFLFTQGFFFLARYSAASINTVLFRQILQASLKYVRHPIYLEAMKHFMSFRLKDWSKSESEMKDFRDRLVENLACPSHYLRQLTLELLITIEGDETSKQSQALILAHEIESGAFTLDSMRTKSLMVRKLAQCYQSLSDSTYIRRILLSYCFGLLHVKLSSIWNDACEALATMVTSKEAEEDIAGRALEWLQNEAETLDDNSQSSFQFQPAPFLSPDTQCSNVIELEYVAEKSSTIIGTAVDLLIDRFRSNLIVLPLYVQRSRSQALLVLKKLPQLAEKRSRMLVPLCLEWLKASDTDDAQDPTAETDTDSDRTVSGPLPIESHGISREDRIGLMDVFSQFVNPNVLYKSPQVYDAFLRILCNGNTEMQRSALKSIFTWKSQAVKPYEVNLLNLLDQARFHEELIVFLNVEEEQSAILAEHRAGLMPIVTRLLYGRVVARSTGQGTRDQKTRRRAVMLSLARFGKTELGQFITVALSPLDKLQLLRGSQLDEEKLTNSPSMPLRKQLGLLKMISDLIDTLSNLLSPFVEQITNAIIFCLIGSSRAIHVNPDETFAVANLGTPSTLMKSVRQDGFSCLARLFSTCSHEQLAPFSGIILKELVFPRLHNMPAESAQGVSSMLRLFSAWTESDQLMATLADPNHEILLRCADCLTIPSAQDEPRIFVLEKIFDRVVAFASQDRMDQSEINVRQEIKRRLADGLADYLLARIATLLQRLPSVDCIKAGIRTILSITTFVTGTTELQNSIRMSVHLLRQPSKIINPYLKGELLKVLQAFLPLFDVSQDQAFFESTVETVASQFSYFKDLPNRHALSEVFCQLASHDEELKETAQLCRNLNAMSTSMLSQPDFDLRMQAFHTINEGEHGSFGIKQWQPIIHNLLYLVRDEEELSMRRSASHGLRVFVQEAFARGTSSNEYSLLVNALIPALQKGMREPSDLILEEYILVLAEIVKHDCTITNDLKGLEGADEESSVFNNILHVQQHRRARALHRLAAQASTISVQNISQICIPLIQRFITNDGEGAHNLATDAINTFGALCEALDWKHFRNMLQRMACEKNKFESKLKIRSLAAAVKALANTHRKKALDFLADGETTTALMRSLPDSQGLFDSLSKPTLVQLLDFVHFKDESTLDLRVMAASMAIRLILTFPEAEVAIQLPPVILDVCNVLKSRSQESRDSARKTLAEIAALIGAPYFGFILKQLRSVLQRGYQMHVLSYTVHSLLVSVFPSIQPGDLDYCTPDLMSVIIDDIFGNVGQEKDAEEYISRMREVKKKTLGYDSMELVAVITTPQHVSKLLAPIQEEFNKYRPKLEKIDELLRRLREGLRRSAYPEHGHMLQLCFDIMRDAYQTGSDSQQITMRGSQKLLVFALDLLRRTLDKYETLKTPTNLVGFMPMLGLSLRQFEGEIQVAAMRCLTAIIKIPLPELDRSAAEYMRSAKRTIDAEPSTHTPLAQAALRLMSALIRERPDASIKQTQFETHVGSLLTRITPDLAEAGKAGERDRQVAAFNFMKAILSRGLVVQEVYRVMDAVREVAVTSTEHPIPDLARSVYARFLLDYPLEDGKSSSAKGLQYHLDFLSTNLIQYPRPEGRLSIMEILDFLLRREDAESVQGLATQFFVPLLLASILDDSEDCRKSARLLLPGLVRRADGGQMKVFRKQLHMWLDADKTDALWRRVGFQGWDVYFEATLRDDDNETTIQHSVRQDASLVVDKVMSVIRSAMDEQSVDDTLVLQKALETASRVCSIAPETAFAVKQAQTWSTVSNLLQESDSPTIQIASSNLLKVYLIDFARKLKKNEGASQWPLAGKGAIRLSLDEAGNIAESCSHVLKSTSDEKLVQAVIGNMQLIGRLSLESEDFFEKFAQELSLMVRQEICGYVVRSAALTQLTTLCKLSTNERLNPCIPSILLTLNNLTDPAIPQGDAEGREELVGLAQELQDYLQSKLGMKEFLSQLQPVQSEVRKRREERRAKRQLEVVTAPERARQQQQRKHELGKNKRREKNAQAAGNRRGW